MTASGSQSPRRDNTIAAAKAKAMATEKSSTSSPSTTAATKVEWEPSLSRRHSWNDQDMRHELHRRLTGLEPDRKSGFTEDVQQGGS